MDNVGMICFRWYSFWGWLDDFTGRLRERNKNSQCWGLNQFSGVSAILTVEKDRWRNTFVDRKPELTSSKFKFEMPRGDAK